MEGYVLFPIWEKDNDFDGLKFIEFSMNEEGVKKNGILFNFNKTGIFWLGVPIFSST